MEAATSCRRRPWPANRPVRSVFMTIPGPTEWSDSMLTGVDEIDQQHRVLVNTLNDFAAKLAGNSDDRLFEQVTRDLLAYAIYHFETEEELIKRYGYDAAENDDANAH